MLQTPVSLPGTDHMTSLGLSFLICQRFGERIAQDLPQVSCPAIIASHVEHLGCVHELIIFPHPQVRSCEVSGHLSPPCFSAMHVQWAYPGITTGGGKRTGLEDSAWVGAPIQQLPSLCNCW